MQYQVSQHKEHPGSTPPVKMLTVTYFFQYTSWALLWQEEILAYNCKSTLTAKVIPTSISWDPNTIVENLHWDKYINVLGFNLDYLPVFKQTLFTTTSATSNGGRRARRGKKQKKENNRHETPCNTLNSYHIIIQTYTWLLIFRSISFALKTKTHVKVCCCSMAA